MKRSKPGGKRDGAGRKSLLSKMDATRIRSLYDKEWDALKEAASLEHHRSHKLDEWHKIEEAQKALRDVPLSYRKMVGKIADQKELITDGLPEPIAEAAELLHWLRWVALNGRQRLVHFSSYGIPKGKRDAIIARIAKAFSEEKKVQISARAVRRIIDKPDK